MENDNLRPFKLDSDLTDYMPIPRALAVMNLPSTAKLLYAALLDRATLSRKNQYADQQGRIFVIYPIENLAQTFQISDTAVKRHLRELEEQGLIYRQRQARNHPNHIFVNLPAQSLQEPAGETKCTLPGAKTSPGTGRKVPGNNRKEQHKKNYNYQHRGDESL